MGDKKYVFQKLTPVSNADISVYEEAINFVFENSDVKNVAISGAYSAGKSSILESYKAKHKKIRFVHLSLAHFRTPEQENDEADDVVKESVLEGKILNQLIHQITAEKIPQTNFRVKKGVNAKNIAALTVFASLFIGSIVFLLSLSGAASFAVALQDNWVKSALSVLFSPYAAIPATAISIVCSVAFIFSLIKAQKNKNIFRKISLQGNEIEIFEEQDDSYFDKYLNEVLYLFENVEADVIVFEDMDRFNASRIFERLREVNTLVNINRKKDQGDKYVPLRFFYLLRDDIFVSKDRTKFFDFIIPIVPVVDSSNSYEQFLKHLKDGGLLDKFDQSFLQSLSLYVDDMRILKNIYNEFVVYIHRLNTTDLDWNKMMAMIAYKNLFPRDFSDLQLAKGFVFAVIAQRQILIEEALTSAKEQRQAIIDRIEWAKKETLTSQQELTDVYAAKESRLPKDYYGRLTTEGNVKKKQHQEEMAKRKQAIQDILDGNLPNLEAEIVDIDRELALTSAKPLKDLITRKNIDNIFTINHTNEIGEVIDFKEIKGSCYFALLKFLIRNGFVDETYTDYMTYFYEDSISANDKTFLRHITDKRGANYTYALREPKKVVESPILGSIEFGQEETLNFDLLECLLLNRADSKYAEYLKALISQIKKTKNFDFVSKFYDTGKAHREFVISINELWDDFFHEAWSHKKLPEMQIRQYSIDTLYYSDDDSIKKVNGNGGNCLSYYISCCPDYLNVKQPDIDRLAAAFSLIDVSFASIDYEKADKALFDAVYQLNLYKLTFENIALMLKKMYGIENDSDIAHKNYTLVKSHTDSPLAAYIANHMSVYTKIILANCGDCITDEEDVAVALLNSDVSLLKTQYIQALTTNISKLEKVNEFDLWPALMEHEIVEFSISNFVNYFLKHELDDVLCKYINDSPANARFTSISNDYVAGVAESIFNAVSINNDISTEKYRRILCDLGFYFAEYEASDISADHFKILIDESILAMDIEGLKYVREKYSAHLFAFIQHNLDEYLVFQTEEIFEFDEALQILSWSIDDDKKTSLLEFTNEPISIVGKQYSDAVNAYIIENNFSAEDKPSLYAQYSQYGQQTREAIIALVATQVNVKEIITKNMTVDDAMLSVLLQSEIATRDQKIMLFTMAVPSLNEESCSTHFDELGLSELKGIFVKAGGRRNYEKNKEVTAVLDALKTHSWIYEYREDERNNTRYEVIKKQAQKQRRQIRGLTGESAMTHKTIERYLNETLKPQLLALELQDVIISDTLESIRPQMVSCISHWNDERFRNALLAVVEEEAIFYRPKADIDIRCFVVVTIRNSVLESVHSLTTNVYWEGKSISPEVLRGITSAAIEYFRAVDFSALANEIGVVENDLYGDLAVRYPITWETLAQIGTNRNQIIEYEAIKREAKPNLHNLRKQKGAISATLENGRGLRSMEELSDGYAISISQELRDAIHQRLHDKVPFIVDSFKGISRNLEKLLTIMEYMMYNGGFIVTSNYLIANGHIECRLELIKPGHSMAEMIINWKNQKGLTKNHKGWLQAALDVAEGRL
jgi:uncharacterized protein (UPF0335 family)